MSLDQANVVATLPRNDREEVRIAISDYKGRTRVDIRVWYLVGDEHRPGKQGISLPVDQLPALQDAIERAQVAARPHRPDEREARAQPS